MGRLAQHADQAIIAPLLKKTVAGFSSPITDCDKSRSSAPQISCGFFVCAPVMAARMGGRKPCRVTPVGTGLLTRSSRHPRLAAGVPVFYKPNRLEATMSQSIPASFLDACNFPYALSDDAQTKLLQLQGLLEMLSSLSGEAAYSKPNQQPPMSNCDLHHGLWGLNTLLNEVMDSMVTRPFSEGAPA